ncbi:MAG: desulfoferrodoxin [Clostridiales bacterium]|nr:desulfoferrodoxin [Clostridiales bacterium]
MEVKFYRCSHCGNIVVKVVDSKVPVMCCGAKMEEIVPGSVDAAVEKHVPVIVREGGLVTVSVGSVAHPMAEEHYIPLVVLETTAGVQFASLNPGDDPKAVFAVLDSVDVIAAYAYCNLHGLWKA